MLVLSKKFKNKGSVNRIESSKNLGGREIYIFIFTSFPLIFRILLIVNIATDPSNTDSDHDFVHNRNHKTVFMKLYSYLKMACIFIIFGRC